MHGPINVESPNNTSKWQMGFNSAFKGLMQYCCWMYRLIVTACRHSQTVYRSPLLFVYFAMYCVRTLAAEGYDLCVLPK
jgi:hypothetical protein